MAKGKILKTIIDISGEISPTLGKSLDEVVGRLEGVNVKALKVGAAVTAIGGAVAIGVGKATGYLKDLGTEYDKASNQMAASTGLVGDELANMEKQMQDVYANNFGDDMADVADSMAEVYKQTKETGDALQNTTEGAFALRDTFGYEVPESARAAKAMMTNFGISGEEAMSLIAAGAQNGLDYSGELIDSINEYSVQFAKLGFNADDMFKIFQKGAESGAWNLDKVGDAIKEFSIRSIDGSKTTTEAFTALNMDAEKMMATFAKGGTGAEKAFQQVLNSLMKVDSEVERDAIGVALFGTQWEDLGVDAVAAMKDVKGGAYDTGNALEKINAVKYNDLDSAMQGIKRKMEVALLPAADAVADAFINLSPKIEAAIEQIAPHIANLAEQIGPALEKVVELCEKGFGWIIENGPQLIPIISGIASAFALFKTMTFVSGILGKIAEKGGLLKTVTSGLGKAFGALNWKFLLIAAVIGAVVGAGVWLYQNWDLVKEKAAQLGAWLSKTWTQIKTKTSQVFKQIGNTISKTWTQIKTKTANLWKQIVNGIVSKVNNLKSKISSYFSQIASKISSTWNSIKSKASSAWSNIVSTITSKASSIYSKVSGAFSNVYSTVSSWMSNIKSTISNAWSNIVTSVSNFVGNIKTKISEGFGQLLAIMRAPFDAIAGVIEGVISKVNRAISKINELTGLNIPGLATGGFTNGLTFAGEDPRYPMEAVISFNPAYRQQNLAYWAKAGQMLGADASDFALGGGDGGVYYDLGGITFAPNIVINGDADKRTVMQAIEDEYPEFLDMLDEFLRRRKEPTYA